MSLAAQMASTPAMRHIFSPRASVQAMLDVEAALAQAGAAIGIVPPDSATAIAAACDAAAIDIDTLIADGAHAGSIVIPLAASLKQALPAHAAHVHKAATSQDIIDTALVLQLRTGIALLQAELATIANAAASLAQTYATTPMLGRTLLQPALPITFGLKASNWLTAINDSRRAITHAGNEALRLQSGGAAGTLDILQSRIEEFLTAFGAALHLPVPIIPWHTSRAPLCRLAAAIAGAVAVTGKIGTDIALCMQPEIAELAEPAAPGRGGSSAMAHKRNPTLSIAARAAATRMPGYVATLLTASTHEHERAAGPWQAEAATWPSLMLCASGGVHAIAQALPGLEVFPAAMEKNLNLPAPPAIPPAAEIFIAKALADHQNL